ncbi:MAG: hypothetical protein ACJ05G_02010 [Actinomycetota bacterium]|nr:hypothetical protein [Acidimicrobiales bacterium]
MALVGQGQPLKFCCSGLDGCETGQDVCMGEGANCAVLAASGASLFEI